MVTDKSGNDRQKGEIACDVWNYWTHNWGCRISCE